MQNAVEEFHQLGFVHLDLRVPNICFHKIDGHWQAVLIDLAYSHRIMDSKSVKNDSSVMYNVDFDRKEMYDWHQFAIMLVQSNHNKYHDFVIQWRREYLLGLCKYYQVKKKGGILKY